MSDKYMMGFALRAPFGRFKWIRALASLWLAFALSFASARAEADLPYFLSLDRFEYYLGELADVVRSRGRPDLADFLAHIRPEEVAASGISAAELSDVQKYDGLAARLLKARPGVPAFREAELTWNYNFHKNKLQEAFRLDMVDKPTPPHPYPHPDGLPEHHVPDWTDDLHEAASADITLDTDQYISSRTTRAVFWDATANHRQIEFHLGSEREFLDRVRAQGVQVIGEVRTLARNYNKIYLIRRPGESGYHYAITGISGNDRLQHLIKQLPLATWPGAGSSAKDLAKIYGKPSEVLAEDEKTLTAQLESLPKADHVIIGQKGAIESTLTTLSKAEASLRALQADPESVQAALTADQFKKLRKLEASGDLMSAQRESAKFWHDLSTALKPVMDKHGIRAAEFESFTLSNDSHEVTDVVLRDVSGKPRRWRLISNTWGDEIVPIAKALKSTGHHDVTYIGTAGAFEGAGLEVGDLAVPAGAYDASGTYHAFPGARKLPPGGKEVKAVSHVGSPYEETHEWLAKERGHAQLVELETGYLGEIFQGPEDNLQVYLLISDVVGSKHETLASADSGARKKAQQSAMAKALEGISGPIDASEAEVADPLEKLVAEAAPKRDIVSRYQLLRKARIQSLQDSPAVGKLAAEEKVFTTDLLVKSLLKCGDFTDHLIRIAKGTGLEVSVRVPTPLLDGTYNPRAGPLALEWFAQNAASREELEKLLQEELKRDPKLRKLLEVKVSTGPPPSDAQIASGGRYAFLNAYNESALKNEGLAALPSGNGDGQKFVQIPLRSKTEGLLPGSEANGCVSLREVAQALFP